MKELWIDLTPWVRGPLTGVGLSAFHSYVALSALNPSGFHLSAVSRDRSHTTPPFPLRPLSPWRRWRGERNALYHGFECALPRLLKTRKILTVHDLWTLDPNPYQDPRFQRRQGPRLNRAIHSADLIVTPTEWVQRQLLMRFPEKQGCTAVVPWAPLQELASEGEEDPRVLSYLEEKRPFILVVACVEVRKNLPVLFQAMRASEGLDLILVGAPGFGSEKIFEDWAGLSTSGIRCAHFRALNHRSLRRLYSACFALVQPSLDEGFGIPVVEAMRFGRPLVLSKIPPLEEVAGEAGLYFPLDGGAAALRVVLDRLRNSPELVKRYSELSRKQAALFSWERTARRLVEIYQRD